MSQNRYLPDCEVSPDEYKYGLFGAANISGTSRRAYRSRQSSDFRKTAEFLRRAPLGATHERHVSVLILTPPRS